MRVSLIAAVAKNGTIGRDNDLPWKIRDDMRFFVAKTRGHTVITGRKNMDAMGRALPKRTNLVVSRDANLTFDGCTTVTSLEQALRFAADRGESEAFVIGGAQLYALALPFAHTFYRTRVLADVPGDVRFPVFDENAWSVVEVARHERNDENEFACVIEELTARADPQAFR